MYTQNVQSVLYSVIAYSIYVSGVYMTYVMPYYQKEQTI